MNYSSEAMEIVASARSAGCVLRLAGSKIGIKCQESPVPLHIGTLVARNKQAIIAALLSEKRAAKSIWQVDDWHSFILSRGIGAGVIEYLNRHPANTSPSSCAQCGLQGDSIVPYGITDSHIWLHHHCQKHWLDSRKRMAIAELESMGVKVGTDSYCYKASSSREHVSQVNVKPATSDDGPKKQLQLLQLLQRGGYPIAFPNHRQIYSQQMQKLQQLQPRES